MDNKRITPRRPSEIARVLRLAARRKLTLKVRRKVVTCRRLDGFR